MARSLLRYRLIRLSGVAAADRDGALRAQLAAWQPFDDSLYLIDILGDQAQVFALDQGQLPASMPPSVKVLWPESLLGEPGVDGLRLVRALEGFEGQAWQAGVLQSCRWWAAQPDADEWQAFARQARVAGEIALPTVQSIAWLRPARTVLRADQLGRAGLGQERLLIGACVLVLLTFSTAVARDAWEAYRARAEAEARLASLKQEVAPLLAARERALATADQSAQLLKQLELPAPLDVIDQLAQLLPKGAVVKELDLQPGSLKIALELSPEVSRAKLVNDLESGGWFVQVSEVKETVARSWVGFEMKLAGARPPGKKGSNDAGLVRGAAEPPPLPPDLPGAQTSPIAKPSAGGRT